MKKGLGKIRKIKKKHIFLALLAVIVLGGLAKAYSAWVGTTRFAFSRCAGVRPVLCSACLHSH